jgi:hypothetical protein
MASGAVVELRNTNVDFIRQSDDSETGLAMQGLGGSLIAFYGDAVAAAILIFSSRNIVSAAIRMFLGASS